jgi:hypothetical protein
MDKLTKLELNVIIERLIASLGADEEARLAVARFAERIRSETGVSANVSAETRGGSFTGFTAENGAVKVEDDSKQMKEWSIGDKSQRVGYFKISRKTYKRALFWVSEERIVITHFWKADIETESETEDPEAWCLSCNSKMEPVWFGQYASVELFTSKSFSVVLREIRETWGKHIGAVHPDNVSVKLRVQM